MSAYMVADQTINRVVTWLAGEIVRSSALKRRIETNLSLDTDNPFWPDLLGLAMFQLNIAGVEERYGRGEAKRFRDLTYRYRPVRAAEIQVLKSLHCFLYQCTEGAVVSHPLYQFCESVCQLRLMQSIITALPEYEAAEWG